MSPETDVGVSTRDSWLSRLARSVLKKDVMTRSERIGEVASMVAVLLITAFFVYHQVNSTGFFTSKFGATEQALFYGAALFGLITGGARAILGRRSSVRPLEIAGGVLWIVASLWLYIVFPFNFAHLADTLPGFLRFTLSWITNDIGRALLILGILGGMVATIDPALRYTAVRWELSRKPRANREEPVAA